MVEQDKEKNTCGVITIWIIQILLWITMLFSILGVNEYQKLNKYQKDDQDLFSYLNEHYLVFFYIFYFLHLLCGFIFTGTFQYLNNINSSSELINYISSMYNSNITWTFIMKGFHYEIVKKYNNKTKTYTESTNKIDTYTETMNLNYTHITDKSEAFGNILEKNNENGIRLNMFLKCEIANDGSMADYNRQKFCFIENNRFRDTEHSFTESIDLPKFSNYILLKPNNGLPTMINLIVYLVFLFLGFGEIYTLYLNNNCPYETYSIQKVISTRSLNTIDHKIENVSQDPSVLFQSQNQNQSNDKTIGSININDLPDLNQLIN